MFTRVQPRRIAARLRPWHLVGVLIGGYLALTLAANSGDPMTFVIVGTRFDPGLPDGSMGYDGQFAYQIARDPLSGWQRLDSPAYRYQRILYPALARLFAFGQSDWLPWSLMLVNFIALILGVIVFERLMITNGFSPWYALVYGLNVGMVMAVRLDLTEPLAYLLAGLGALLAARERWWLSSLCFALAVLAKEVTLLLAVGYILHLLTVTPRWRGMLWAFLTFLPFAAWQLVIRLWLGEWGFGSGGALSSSFELIPLRGWWVMATYDMASFAAMSLLVLPLAILPALVGLALAIRELWRRSWQPATWALLLTAGMVLFLPTSNILDPLGLSRFLIGLIVAFLLFGAQHNSQRVLLYTQLWVFTLIFVAGDNFLPYG